MLFKGQEGYEGVTMKIEILVLGPLANNVYLIEGEEGLIVVDPSCEVNRILQAIDGRTVTGIVLTHRHFDHVGAAHALRKETGAPVIASVIDAPVIAGEEPLPDGTPFENCPIDIRVQDGELIKLSGIPWKAMITPGHTQGSMCLFYEGDASEDDRPILISGDTLFKGAHGRVDFAGGSQTDMNTSLERLVQLPDETVVLPGHNDITTIEREKTWIC